MFKSPHSLKTCRHSFFAIKMSSSPYTFSDSETIDDTNSTISESNTIIQNQRQQISSTRKNRSHTIFFFRVDGDFAYCKICESNFANTNKRAYGYSRKGGNTTNLIAHLRDKYNITKDNYSEYLDEHEEVFHFLIKSCDYVIQKFFYKL